MNRIIRFLRSLSLRCDPLLACVRHGRCWTHSEWEKSELPPGWMRKREENPGPNSRWVSYIVRPEIRIVEDCNPEADVAKYKLDDALQKAWEIHEAAQ